MNESNKMEENILFCPIYNKILDDMIKKKNAAKTDTDKLNVLMEFADRHTMLPDQQTELLRLSKQCEKNLPEEMSNCLYSTFYADKNAKHIDWSNHQKITDNLYNSGLSKRFQLAEEALSFPHKWLDLISQTYLYYSVQPIPKAVEKQYKYLRALYYHIIKHENDIDNWLECIRKIENKEALIANLELKLGQDANWKSKKLWKFYFNFLKEKDMIEILDVFRKYTRLFICDKQAVTHYRKTLETFSLQNVPTTKYWIDTIKYETNFGKLSVAYRTLGQALKAVIGQSYHFVAEDKNDLLEKIKIFEKKMLEFEELHNSVRVAESQSQISAKPAIYYQNSNIQQHFCFHQSFIQNLVKNANGTILGKLYATCKFFYLINKAPLCYRLEINADKNTRYCREALYIDEKDINFDGLNKLHLYHGLLLSVNSNKNILSNVIQKLKFCEILYLDIKNQNITDSEFKFMLSKHLFQIMMVNVNIYNKNGSINDAKELLKFVKDYPSLRYWSFVNQSVFLTAFIYDGVVHNKSKVLRKFNGDSNFKAIYIAEHTISSLDLQHLINYNETKFVTLYNTVVTDESGNKMEKQQLKEFIVSKVDPKNRIFVETADVNE